MIPKLFFQGVSRTGFAVCLAAGLAAGFGWNWKAALGVWVGASWMFVNLFFLFKFIERPKTFAFAVVKFPVLYLAGFYILRTRFFSPVSLLAGLTAFLAAFLIVWVRGRLCTS